MTTTLMLERYRSAITATQGVAPADPSLLIERSGNLSCHYAPFDHINSRARVVLLGMTPGTQQARNALDALRSALAQGRSDVEALAIAKTTGSFSGPLRSNLVAMLDAIGLHRKLGINSCAELFGSREDLVHFTSALRYPVLLDGANYQGSPSILATPFLRQMAGRWLAEEVQALADAFWIPLGNEARSVLLHFAAEKLINRDLCLDGLPHPSGANAERIAYFLGNKPRNALSAKTNADDLDTRKQRLLSQLGHDDPATVAQQAPTPAPVVSAGGCPNLKSEQPKAIGTSATVRQAEEKIAAIFRATRRGTDKISGYETNSGRHLAIDRKAQRIQIWTEAVDKRPPLGTVVLYSASRPRHSNLASQAPRVATGREALLWNLEPSELPTFLEWYQTV